MKSLVVYASRTGNTKVIASLIADSLNKRGDATLADVTRAPTDLGQFDLVIIGGPTEGHGMTPAMTAYLERLDADGVRHAQFAAFDTRLAWPRALSGSAADGIAGRLRARGARLAVSPESFIVSTKPELKPGELEHADRWVREVAQIVQPRQTREEAHA